MPKTSQARMNKNKGKAGQNEVRDLLLDFADGVLEEDDIISNPMGNPGEDLMFSPAARKMFPWSVEIKRKKAIACLRFIEQAAAQKSGYEPVAIFREDRGDWHCCVSLAYLLFLLRRSKNDTRTNR